jgi:thiol-disulfide isomerase/thioredoxin
MLMPRRALPALLALLTTTALLSPVTARAAGPAEIRIGESLPDQPMTGLNGPDRRLASYRGKRLLINVWASWCGPCRQEMASLERLAWQPGELSLTVIGISTDDYRNLALDWLKSSNATLSHYIDHQVQLESLLGASRIPLTVLVDEQGRVLDKIYGAREWDSAESRALLRRAYLGKGKAGAARP